MSISGTDLLEVPTIFKAYVRGYIPPNYGLVRYLRFRILEFPLNKAKHFGLDIWRFPEIGVPLVIIHLRLGFSKLIGYPQFRKPPYEFGYNTVEDHKIYKDNYNSIPRCSMVLEYLPTFGYITGPFMGFLCR